MNSLSLLGGLHEREPVRWAVYSPLVHELRARGVIHDWGDQPTQRILNNCRKAMPSHGKVLVVECVVPEDEPSFSKLLDLNMNMMVMTGGRERTQLEFRELFKAAGLTLTRIIPTLSPPCILEGVRK